MNRTIAICALLVWAATLVVLVAAAPWTISDANKFFKGFVNEQFLGFMGVVVTITLASAANINIELNKIEEKLGRTIFSRTKRDIKHSAFSLIGALISAIVLVILKPLFDSGERAQAIMNGLAVAIILASVLILIDLTQAAFGLELHGED